MIDFRPIRTEADYDAVLAEMLSRKRHLSITHIWKLNGERGIPAESLIRPHELQRQ